MRRLIVISLLLGLFSIIAPVAAQETPPDTGWPVEQRCVGDPTPPPEGWTYDGTIFVQGTQGIRALNQKYATPYFALFESPFIYGASLSPDGKWYAVPTGYRGYATMSSNSYVIDGIAVVKTDTSRESHFVPLQTSYQGMFDRYSVPTVHWIDNTHIIYEGRYDGYFDTYVMEAFTNEVHLWEGKLSPLYVLASPDKTLAVGSTYEDNQFVKKLFHYPSGEGITTLSPNLSDLVWSLDSTMFAAILNEDGNSPDTANHQIVTFDRSGNSKSVILLKPNSQWSQPLTFSADSKFLILLVDNTYFYVADLENQIIIDTCLTLSGRPFLFKPIVWSPDAHQLAFRYVDVITILNLDTNEFYKLSDIPGEVVAWGAA
jgi:hypothetical protein